VSLRPTLAFGVLAGVALAAVPSAEAALAFSVAPPAAAPGVALAQAPIVQASPADLAAMSLRVSELESEVRALAGQVEELNFLLRQLQNQLAAMNAPPAAGTTGTPQGGVAPPGGTTLGPDLSAALGPLDLSVISGPVAAASTVPGASAPAAAPVGPAGTPIAVPDAQATYDAAYAALLAGNLPQAESGFGDFLLAYPDSPLAADAHYWLGETYFEQNEFRAAADQFLTTYLDFPGSTKAPDSLLKLGLSLYGMNEVMAACATYDEFLDRFPDASAALLDRVNAEQIRAGCGAT